MTSINLKYSDGWFEEVKENKFHSREPLFSEKNYQKRHFKSLKQFYNLFICQNKLIYMFITTLDNINSFY